MKPKPVKPAKPALPKARVMYHAFERGFGSVTPVREQPRLGCGAYIPGTAKQSRALVRFFNLTGDKQFEFMESALWARRGGDYLGVRALLAAIKGGK